MKRGEVWWASLPGPTGSGPGFRRPVVVIQSDSFNESKISTVIVAVITSNLALSDAPGNVRLAKRDSGLPKASVVNVSQVFTLDRARLTKRMRTLPSGTMEKLNSGLRVVIGLT
jgi:mRNA interferase MazF